MDDSQVIEDFESAWQQRRYADVDRMLCDSQLPSDSIAELVMIDLEYRWRHPLDAVTQEQVRIPNCPHVEDYFSLIPALKNCVDRRLELVAEEFRVRLQWASPPQARELITRFPEHSDAIRQLVERVRNDVPHLRVSIFQHGQEMIRTRMHRRLEIGRQTIDQPPPFCVIEDVPVPKLVIAALNNVKISRSQIELAHHARGVRIKNLSDQVAVRIGAASKILPGRMSDQELPLSITIGDLELRIAR